MTPNKCQQKPTFKPLSIEQQNAIGLLILGKSDKEVAEAVGVNRTTIWEWRTAHPIFMAPLNDDGPRSGDSPRNDSGHSLHYPDEADDGNRHGRGKRGHANMATANNKLSGGALMIYDSG